MHLRSRSDAERYFKANNIPFNSDIFNFCGKNKFAGNMTQEVEGNNLTEWQLMQNEVNIQNTFHEAINSPQS